MTVSLRTRVIGLCVVAAVLPLLIMLVVTLVLKNVANEKIGGEMERLANANITRITTDVLSLCETAQALVMSRVTAASKGAEVLLKEMGPVRLGPQTYEVDEGSHKLSGRGLLRVPVLHVGEAGFSAAEIDQKHEPYVDEFKELTGLDSTVFVRVNDRGDMMRVATNIRDEEGKRIKIGTVMTADDPIVALVLSGKPYEGVAFVLDRLYAARYIPLQDEEGRVAGMVGVGEVITQIQSIRKSIIDIRVGKDGYAWVLGTKGDWKGKYIISKNGERDKQDVSGDLAEAGLLAKIDQAVHSPRGTIIYASYMWRNPGDNTERKKIAALTYFAEWDWVIGVALYEDNFLEAQRHVQSVLNRLIFALFVSGLAVLVIVLIGAGLSASRFTRSISLAAGASQLIARGDIKRAEKELAKASASEAVEPEETGREETQMLLSSLRSMSQALLSLIGNVQQAGIKVQGCATQIAASASQLNATVTEQAASTAQVSATSRAISQRVQGLSRTMTEVEDVARKSAGLADRGQAGINLLSGSMEELKDATLAVSGKLSAISSKAASIGDIVKTITKVADQTNLLALNAAIEAEKAGDYGLGFSVVAREIKRLSDQTAAAVLDIENVVSDMSEAVTAGNVEMSRFIARVDQEVENVNDIGAGAKELIEGVQELFPRFSQVSAAMAEQSLAAEEISTAMEQLALAVNQTKDSLGEFSSAARGLSQAVGSLQEQSARFSVS
ncbi:MAG: methyl-accepting chemotaxis protein [Thermodesulfobacteriota bacterium]